MEKYPATDEKETLQIIDEEFLTGAMEGNFHKISSVPAFHSIFFKQALTKINLTYNALKYKVEIDENILTDNFRAEMDEYAEAVLGGHKVLGVLIRGTDYIVAKMSGT